MNNKIGGVDFSKFSKEPLDTKKVDKDKISEFTKIFEESLKEVDKLQKQADKAIKELSFGKIKDIHQTMIALKKANISLELMMQIRNKIIEAYQEIMRMQI